MLRRLGLNLLYLVPQQVGGTEIAARRLVPALAAQRPGLEIVVFVGREAGAVLPDPAWPDNVRVVTLPVRATVKPLRLGTELGVLPAAARHHGVDVLHSFGTTSPVHGRFARVTTVHDIIFHHYREAFAPAARLGLQLLVPAGVRRADRVQVSSNATAEELVDQYALPRNRLDVVPLGLGMRDVPAPTAEGELRARLDLGDAPIVLSVAAALPHKNLDRLLQAFAAVRRSPPPRLVLTGHAGRIGPELRERAEALGVATRVRFTGWLSEEDVEGLYAVATAFAYPSLHEGFGMPVLEAMHRGTPVVSADATSLPEVVGDAALLVDARDTRALAGALERILGDEALRADLVARGHERARMFSWERTADAALASYDRALLGHG